eukprot:Nk52_evm47s2152 gene=Nk52_evmTU47s2152
MKTRVEEVGRNLVLFSKEKSVGFVPESMTLPPRAATESSSRPSTTGTDGKGRRQSFSVIEQSKQRLPNFRTPSPCRVSPQLYRTPSPDIIAKDRRSRQRARTKLGNPVLKAIHDVRQLLNELENPNIDIGIKTDVIRTLSHLATKYEEYRRAIVRMEVIRVVMELCVDYPALMPLQIHATSLFYNVVPVRATRSSVVLDEVQEQIFRNGGIGVLLNLIEMLWTSRSKLRAQTANSMRGRRRSSASTVPSSPDFWDDFDEEEQEDKLNELPLKKDSLSPLPNSFLKKKDSLGASTASFMNLRRNSSRYSLQASAMDAVAPLHSKLSDFVQGRMEYHEYLEHVKGTANLKPLAIDMAKLVMKVGRIQQSMTAISSMVDKDFNYRMGKIVSDIKKVMDVRTTTIFLLDEENNFHNFCTCENPPTGDIYAKAALQRDMSLLHIKDVKADIRFDPSSIDTSLVKSVICIPIKTNLDGSGVAKGILQITDKNNAEMFREDDVYYLRQYAQFVTFVTNLNDSEKNMRLSEIRYRSLMQTTKSLSNEVDLDSVIQIIMQAARELVDADRCTLFLVDEATDELWSKIKGPNGLFEIRVPKAVGIAGHAATYGEHVNVKNAYDDPRFNPEVDKRTGYYTRNILCMPMWSSGSNNKQVIGVTQMINKAHGSFGKEDILLLGAFSSQAAVAIEKSRLFQSTMSTRNYLESILNSISNSVMTLSREGHLVTFNRNIFSSVFSSETVESMKTTSYDQWLGDNEGFIYDITKVLETNEPINANDYELRGPKSSVSINYSIVPLSTKESNPDVDQGDKKKQNTRYTHAQDSSAGVVLVVEDVSHEKKMMSTLGRYMSPALVKEVLDEGGGMLGGTRKKVSVLFTDIRSFTKISESMEPGEVVEMLNDHFAEQEEAITANNGILDKYIGDAVMAVFGVPFITEQDSLNACKAALRMIVNLAQYNKRRLLKGKIAIKIGIGINTGEVLSGNIGSERRMEYTVIGDGVNLASRIEGITKQYGAEILVSEFTRQDIEDSELVFRELDVIRVVGKSKPIAIHQLQAASIADIPENAVNANPIFDEGLKLYRDSKWDEAEKKFNTVLKDVPEDGPSIMMLERCAAFKKSPPNPDWGGVWDFASK